MKTTINPHLFKQNIWFKLGIVAVLVVVLAFTLNGRAQATSISIHARSSAATTADVLDGIGLTPSVTDEDAAYLAENLEYLQAQMPLWEKYIQDAKPIVLSIDLRAGEQGRSAYTRCCEGNVGRITFGYHFDQLTLGGDTTGQTVSGRRIAFLAILIHEVTHVRDQRAGRFTVRVDYGTCVEAERSALSTQLQFEREALQILLNDSMMMVEEFNTGFQGNLATETSMLGSRETWLDYCGDLLEQ